MGSSSFFKVEIMLLSTAFSNKYRIKHVPRPGGRYGRGIDVMYNNQATGVIKDISEKPSIQTVLKYICSSQS